MVKLFSIFSRSLIFSIIFVQASLIIIFFNASVQAHLSVLSVSSYSFFKERVPKILSMYVVISFSVAQHSSYCLIAWSGQKAIEGSIFWNDTDSLILYKNRIYLVAYLPFLITDTSIYFHFSVHMKSAIIIIIMQDYFLCSPPTHTYPKFSICKI